MTGDDTATGLADELERIRQLPLDERAAAFAALHGRLTAALDHDEPAEPLDAP